MRRNAFAFCALALAGLLTASAIYAQPPSRQEQRRQFVDGILKTLIESQQRGRPPVRPVPGPVRPVPANPQLREIRGALVGFSGEADHLIADLRREEQYTPAIRPLLSDTLKVKATVDVLSTRCQTMQDPRAIAREFQPLDQQWRILSHRLQQLPDLAAPCVQHVKQLDGYDRKLCKILNVEPQFDRAALTQLLGALIADLRHIHEDIAADFRHSKQQQQLLSESHRLLLSVSQLSRAVGQGDRYEVVVANFKQYAGLWQRYATQLRLLDNRYLVRDIRRVEQLHLEIEDLLWIPHSIDRGRIVHSVTDLNKNLNLLLAGISLRTLLTVPDANHIVTGAAECTQLCRSFGDAVRSGAELDDLLWDYRVVDVEWQNLARRLERCQDAGVQRQLAIVDQNVIRLRESLGIQQDLGHARAAELAAYVDNQMDQLARDIQQRIVPSRRYSVQVRQQVQRSSGQCHELAHELSTGISGRADATELRRCCTDLATNYDALRKQVGTFPQDDRTYFNERYAKLRPMVAELQLLYAY